MSFTAAHWGVYEVEGAETGRPSLRPFSRDPDPSPIGLAALEAAQAPNRVRRPAVRLSWIEKGWGANPERRGVEPFVEVSWGEALDLVARALQATIKDSGNRSVFAGSYGWSSAGRFNHAQSQIHRFFNTLGGYVGHVDSYSLGAGNVIMPRIAMSMDRLIAAQTTWDVLAKNTELFLSFGGVPLKNSQISWGMVGRHTVRAGLRSMAEAKVQFINISPVRSDLDSSVPHEWVPIRPNTDTALLLALAFEVYTRGWHDKQFLRTHCVGFDRFAPYLTGEADGIAKAPEWAQQITGVAASKIRELARLVSAKRSFITAAWSLQRAHHGEQPYWATVALAAMLGQIGLPGGGFGIGYGAVNGIGGTPLPFPGPTLPQGRNPVSEFIPVARVADMLEKPGASFSYNGKSYKYPEVDFVYWAGGNPFHHHQDLNRLLRAWRLPKAVVVNEQFWTATAKAADVVFPTTTTFERDDIGFASKEPYLIAMRKVISPVGEARSDYDIFSALARRLGTEAEFTEGRSSQEWLQLLYDRCQQSAQNKGVVLPPFETFWENGVAEIPVDESSHVTFADFRADPSAHPLGTRSGKLEIFSQDIAVRNYPDCGGHPMWFEPAEWLGGPGSQKHPIHLLSDQPHTRLHSQLDHSSYSRDNKVQGREPAVMNLHDAQERGIREGDLVRIFNDRGSCLAGARLSDGIARGVAKLSTGAWFDPESWAVAGSLEKHGNPNVLTADVGASQLSQGCAAQTCLVQIERFLGAVPPVTAFMPPPFAVRKDEGAD
ncbi:molybdopterin-dependent oxidoreductase [Caenimonas soli]|uniref:molybdopterin-dependent oxidoreductase n=1 Tax=Caenimonas soli TaxID=2735555 RepID=UPI001556A2D0|nr:molybdopterin-dependent oxidoreductase [Caenimonas soli]NPC58523.1 molybdopterin-dependent oxidoreductase [Caenimonas soli]